MDLVELPAAAAVRHGLCIKSAIGDCSFGRPIFVSANLTEYTTRPASSGSRADGFSPYGSGSSVDPKTARSILRNPRSAGPCGGSRDAAQRPISNPSSSRARPIQARYGHLFSRSRPDKSKTARLLALRSPTRQHPGPSDGPAARKSGMSSPPGGVAAGNLLAVRLGSRGGNDGRGGSGPARVRRRTCEKLSCDPRGRPSRRRRPVPALVSLLWAPEGGWARW